MSPLREILKSAPATDFCSALHSYLDGMRIDGNHFALDAFCEVGPGSHFFGTQGSVGADGCY